MAEELKSAVRDILDKNGVLDEVKGKLRSEIFKALQDDSAEITKPKLIKENVLINELFLEYLKFNGYNMTASMLQTESGQRYGRESGMSRDFLCDELNIVNDENSKTPILYGMLSYFQNKS